MKVLIVFLSLLVVNLSFLCYDSDMATYQQLQKELKAISEECAAGASLYFDEEAYSHGDLVIKDEDAVAYVTHLVKRAEKKAAQSGKPAISQGTGICCTLYIIDEKNPGAFRSYRDGKQVNLPDGALPDSVRKVEGDGHIIYEPSVVVDLTMNTGDLFRLPFLKVNRIYRSAMYELSGNHSMR